MPDYLANANYLHSWPGLTLLTVSTQKRSLCSKLLRAKGPGSVFVHSKEKATMRASMTARWAPCRGKVWKMRPEGRARGYLSASSSKEEEKPESRVGDGARGRQEGP